MNYNIIFDITWYTSKVSCYFKAILKANPVNNLSPFFQNRLKSRNFSADLSNLMEFNHFLCIKSQLFKPFWFDTSVKKRLGVFSCLLAFVLKQLVFKRLTSEGPKIGSSRFWFLWGGFVTRTFHQKSWKNGFLGSRW